jgi:hypothetical protein
MNDGYIHIGGLTLRAAPDDLHERRMQALLRLQRRKDAYTKLSVEFILGRNVAVEEVHAALTDLAQARADMAGLDQAP